ncbi:hypothetical protein EW145_g2482 [Phellinidium pouzarii]|uniref:choline-phosphate cytidylyltransferase n=1 Tax=Phellinidium pouzarii TaxID=167371 RepID=A0A4S4LAN8_9AGAM|nr:hypothetical protein EW145_g2482 [Phellinidium pouzarii]
MTVTAVWHFRATADCRGVSILKQQLSSPSPQRTTTSSVELAMAPNPSATYALSETASASDDLNDYDVISDADPRSLDSSIADLDSNSGARPAREIPASDEAKNRYETATMTTEDVQAFVRRSIRGPGPSTRRSRSREREKTFRVYVDGIFDTLHVGTVLQLRQAKLAFPSVHLLVGPFTDIQCRAHDMTISLPHVERCELVRHVRWVDEVLLDAPVVLDETFLHRNRIDYVAVEEGSSVDPAVSKARLAGYDLVKSIGKAIPTRRTRNVTVSSPSVPHDSALPTPAISTRNLEPVRVATPEASPPLPEPSEEEDIPEPREGFGV